MRSKAELLLCTLDLRAGSVIDESEIFALKKRWRPQNCTNRKIDAEQEQADLMENGHYQISDEQAAKGIAWWRSMCFKKDGTRRDTQFTRCNLDEQRWAVVENVTRFELVDWDWRFNGFGRGWTDPIYRMVAGNGAFFDYCPRSWQSGRTANDTIIH
jgi:hypothetical protein